eukprot:gene11272-15123_t
MDTLIESVIYSTLPLHIREGEFRKCVKVNPSNNFKQNQNEEENDLKLNSFGNHLNFNEAQHFYDKGYFILDNAVENTLIFEARNYIDAHYIKWLKHTKRQDDWRSHFCLDLMDMEKPMENAPVLDLLLLSPIIVDKLYGLMGQISGIFYSQIAFRTPISGKASKINVNGSIEDYQPGGDYHLDGQANASGDRFPDHWTVLVGIALVDIISEDMGNFTVFPCSHTSRSWINYPEEKKAKSLPNLGEPVKICLKAGDVIFAHVLLAHRGGKNTLPSKVIDRDDYVKNIKPNTREMVFFRVQAQNINYNSKDRSLEVINNPWIEHSNLINILNHST